MMLKILIWGTGKNSKYVYESVDLRKNTVLAMIDNNNDIHGKMWDDSIAIISPSDIDKYHYDYIVISVRKYEEIVSQCIDLGIDRKKIIPYWEDLHDVCFENRSDEIRRLKRLLDLRAKNAKYEYGNGMIPKIKSGQELLKKMIQDHSSLVRFGDGEFEMILMQSRPWFQSPDEKLSSRLNEVLHTQSPVVNVGICSMFGNLDRYKESDADAKRMYMESSRKDIYSLIDFERDYYDANVTRPYIEYKTSDNAKEIFCLFKKLFMGRKILIIEGKSALNGINNDLFVDAQIIRRGICPSQNAWDKYDSIYNNIRKKVDKDWLICISLGPTATVLAYDLAMDGYQAIDIGQIDNEYDWYRMGATCRVEIPGKQVAEVNLEVITDYMQSDLYKSQILFDCSEEYK